MTSRPQRLVQVIRCKSPNQQTSTEQPALMRPSQRVRIHQQKRVGTHAAISDSYAFFNPLTGPECPDQVESLLPEHRERLFPPTETVWMFLAQAMSADRSCQKAVDDAAIKRLIGGLPICSTHTGAYCRGTETVAIGYGLDAGLSHRTRDGPAYPGNMALAGSISEAGIWCNHCAARHR
jgi:hypothetical protein